MLKYRPYDLDLSRSMQRLKIIDTINDVYEHIITTTSDSHYHYYDETDYRDGIAIESDGDGDYYDADGEDGYWIRTPRFRKQDFYLSSVEFDDKYIGMSHSRYILSDYYNGKKLDKTLIVGVVSPYDDSALSIIKDRICGTYWMFYYPQDIFEANEKERYKILKSSRKE